MRVCHNNAVPNTRSKSLDPERQVERGSLNAFVKEGIDERTRG